MIGAPIRATLLVLGAGLVLAVWPGPAGAQIYKWVDAQGNSHYADGLESVPAPYRAKAVPLGLRNSPTSAGAPSGAPGPAGASGSTTIQFSPGGRIMVDAKINGSGSARLLLDTGADHTVIAPRALTAAGVSLTAGALPGQIAGATGTTEAQGVPIESLEVGGARATRLLVIAHDVNQPGIDGLLGRDFLGQFNVTIDSTKGTVTIAPK